jgi:hypothetical protein
LIGASRQPGHVLDPNSVLSQQECSEWRHLPANQIDAKRQPHSHGTGKGIADDVEVEAVEDLPIQIN